MLKNRNAIAVAVGLAAVLIPAGAAHAKPATSYVTKDEPAAGRLFVNIAAVPGAANDVRLSKVGATVMVIDGDAGARAKAGSNCSQSLAGPIADPTSSFVLCDLAKVEEVNAKLGDGDDRSLKELP